VLKWTKTSWYLFHGFSEFAQVPGTGGLQALGKRDTESPHFQEHWKTRFTCAWEGWGGEDDTELSPGDIVAWTKLERQVECGRRNWRIESFLGQKTI
jgi:hypothetical protein